MIIATITIFMLVFGGPGFSFDVYKHAAADVIEDKERVKQIKDITKEADKEMKALNKYFKSTSEEIVEMMTRSDVTREELNASFDKVENRREEFQEALIQLRFQAVNLLSREEWEAMYAKVK
jgi:Spy/CpxP family protein refolding chaperone